MLGNTSVPSTAPSAPSKPAIMESTLLVPDWSDLRFQMVLQWINNIQKLSDEFRKKKKTAKKLMVWVSICNKTGLLTGIIAVSIAATGIGSLPGIMLAGHIFWSIFFSNNRVD